MLAIFNDIKKTLYIALPLMAAFLAQKGMQVVDNVMMGKIGTKALAAGSLGLSIYGTIMIFCMGTLSAIGVFISRAIGAKQLADVHTYLANGILLALALSIPSMVLMWFSPHMLLFFGEDPAIVEKASLLLHSMIWGLPGFFCFLVFRELISAFSLTRVVMLVALGSIPLVYCANTILIYGMFGFPQLGIAGIGFATAIIQWFMFFCLWFYSVKHVTLKNYVPRLNINNFQWKKIKDILYIGTPSGTILMFDVGLCLLAAMLMGFFGTDTLASHQIAMQCASIAYAIPFGLSMATALQVSRAAGANDLPQVKRSAVIGLSIGILLSLIVAALFFFTPEIFVKPFLNPSENNTVITLRVAAGFLAIAALFQCLDSVLAIMNGGS